MVSALLHNLAHDDRFSARLNTNLPRSSVFTSVWYGLDANPLPIKARIVSVLQKDKPIVGSTVRYKEKAPVRRCEYAITLGNEPLDMIDRSTATKNRIKCPFADNQVKGTVAKREPVGDVGTNEFHL
jgi:hypothetical protein